MAENENSPVRRQIEAEERLKEQMKLGSGTDYQIFASLKRHLKKEKNVILAKLRIVYALGPALQARSTSKLAELRAALKAGYETANAEELFAQARLGEHSAPAAPSSDEAAGLSQALKDHVLTRQMYLRVVAHGVLKRKPDLVKSRLTTGIESLSRTGKLQQAMAGMEKDEFIQAMEQQVTEELAAEEVEKKTKSHHKKIEEIQTWYAEHQELKNDPLRARTFHARVENMVKEIRELTGFISSAIKRDSEADGVHLKNADLQKFKANVHQQATRFRTMLKAADGLSYESGEPDSAARQRKLAEHWETLAGAAKALEEQIREERLLMVALSRQEGGSVEFIDDVSGVVAKQWQV